MLATRLFVSYAIPEDQQGAEVVRQLLNDLQIRGVEVVTDDDRIADEDLVEYLNQELPRCQYCILVQTPLAWKSLRVQTSVSVALDLVAQQHLQGMLRLVVVPVKGEEEHPLWVLSRAFDASRDYSYARDQLFLEMGLLQPDDEMPTLVDQPLPPSTVDSTIAFPAGGSPGAPFPGSQHTPPPQPSALIDRPGSIPWRHRSPRLWISVISAGVILALVLALGALGVAALQVVKHMAVRSTVQTAHRGFTPTPSTTLTRRSTPSPTANPVAQPTPSPSPQPSPSPSPQPSPVPQLPPRSAFQPPPAPQPIPSPSPQPTPSPSPQPTPPPQPTPSPSPQPTPSPSPQPTPHSITYYVCGDQASLTSTNYWVSVPKDTVVNTADYSGPVNSYAGLAGDSQHPNPLPCSGLYHWAWDQNPVQAMWTWSNAHLPSGTCSVDIHVPSWYMGAPFARYALTISSDTSSSSYTFDTQDQNQLATTWVTLHINNQVPSIAMPGSTNGIYTLTLTLTNGGTPNWYLGADAVRFNCSYQA